jgi:dephospho-CoA kinase
MIIVLIGQHGVGKTKLSKLLSKDLNFNLLEISDLVKSLLAKNSREDIVGLTKIKNAESPNWLANALRVKLSKKRNWVISGSREIIVLNTMQELTKQQPMYIIKLECADKTRFKRSKDKHTKIEELYETDAVDNSLGLAQVLEQADHIVNTEGTVKESYNKILDLVETFGGF